METATNKVIVLGGDHHNTLGVIRSLGEKGITPFAVLSAHKSSSFVSRSRYLSRSFHVDDEEDCVRILLDHFSTEREKPVIISCSDKFASILDLNYDKLKDKFYLPNAAKQGELNRLMNKETMGVVAESCGFQTIPSWVIDAETNQIPAGISYPCITKPLYSIKGTKHSIRVCENELDLVKVIDSSGGSEVQIQRFIDKEAEFQLFGCSINGGSTIAIPGFSKIIRSTQITNTGFLELCPISDFEMDITPVYKFLRKIKFSGLFSIELLEGKNGKKFFMEINFRNDVF